MTIRGSNIRSLTSVIITGVIILLVGILVGYLALVLSYCIPPAMQTDEINESTAVFSQEGSYPLDTFSGVYLDNFTDSIMLQVASYSGDESVFEKAACSYYWRVSGMSPVPSFLRLHSAAESTASRVSYARYWHGYQVVLRPLLTMFNYGQIRLINLAFQTVLLAVLLVIIGKRMPLCSVPFMFLILFLTPTANYKSLQYSSMYYIMLCAVLILLLFCDRIQTIQGGNGVYYFFLLLGMVTAYMDFLTFPTISLTVPLCLFCVIRQTESGASLARTIRLLLFCCVSWAAGYAGMWAGKWLIAFANQGPSFIETLSDVMSVRSSTVVGIEITRFDAVLDELKELAGNKALFAAAFAYGIGQIVMGIRGKPAFKKMCAVCIPYILVAVIPLAWTMFMANHTRTHTFTFRNLAPCVFALLTATSLLSYDTDRSGGLLTKECES